MELDKLVTEDLVQFREKILDSLQVKHPHIMSFINAILSGKQNKVGMQVADDGLVIGEYTFILSGVRIGSVEKGTLVSEVHHPFLGVIKPYAIVERTYLEKMIKDEGFINNLIGTFPRYLPGITIKFME